MDQPGTPTTGRASAWGRALLAAWPPLAAWLAWGLWALVVAQVGVGLLLGALNGLTPRGFVADFVVAVVAAALAFTTVGVLIVRRYPRHAIGWLFCAAGIGNGLFAWSGQYARYALVTRPGAVPGGEAAFWVNLWAWMPVEATVVLFLPLLFPDGRLPSARWRPLAWLAAIATALASVAIAFGHNGDSFLSEFENPLLLPDATGVLTALGRLGTGLLLVSLLGAVAATATRLRRARGVERQQLKWFAFGAALLIAAFVTAGATFLSGVATDGTVGGALLAFGLPCVPVATGIAILRHRLYDIDLIISRALVYGALTAAVVGLYILVVGYLGALFQTDRGSGTLLISLVAAGVVAVVFQPLRERLQRGVNRLLYGERDEPYAVIARLGQRLEETPAADAALAAIVETVAQALKLPHAAIWLADGETLRLGAAYGRRPSREFVEDAGAVATLRGTGQAEDGLPRAAFDPAGAFAATLAETDTALVLPLAHRGEFAGALCLAARGPGESFSPGDRRLLRDLASHAGAATRAVQLTVALRASLEELRRSRERLVEAGEEERRRIQRDLHDGLGPVLASMRLRLEACLDLAEGLSPDLTKELERLDELVGQATGDIRRLVYALRPPALDQLGLVPALRQHAERFQRETGVAVRFSAEEGLTIPAAAEVALLRVVQEALVNVQRHARASRVEVGLEQRDGWLVLEVADDGVGFTGDGANGPNGATRGGTGLRSMRERAELLGGAVELTGRPGAGAAVVVRIPARR